MSNLKCKAKIPANCPYHGAKQVEAARNAMLTATQKVAVSVTLDELREAKADLAAANESYDATNEGQRKLQVMISDADPIEGAALTKRLQKAEAHAKEAEDKNARSQKSTKIPSSVLAKANKSNELVPLVFPEDHTYDAPTYEVVGEDFYAPTVGSKFTKWRHVAEIAKDVRADLKKATDEGYLPQGLKYSVKIDTYSGGQSIRTEIQNVKEEDIYDGVDPYGRAKRSEDAKKLEKRVGDIVGAYSSSVNRGEVDYVSSTYFSHTVIEDARARQYRFKEAAQAKAKKEAKPYRDNFRTSYAAEPEVALRSINFTHEKEGASVGRVGNTNLFVHKTEYNGRTNVRAYDLSDTELAEGAVPEDYVLKYAGRSSSLERKNFLKVRRSRRG